MKAGLTDFIAGNRMLGFVKFGLIPSLLIEAKTTIPTFDTNNSFTGRETFNITNRVSTFDLAGLGEIGIGCKIVNRLWLTASFIYQHSLTSITNNEYFDEDIKIRHKGMTLNIGLKWAL